MRMQNPVFDNKKALNLDQYSLRNQGIKNSTSKIEKIEKFYKI